jgi:hypothetical protein
MLVYGNFERNVGGSRNGASLGGPLGRAPLLGTPKEILGIFFELEDINPLTPELNPYAQRCLTRFLLRILLLEPCISLIYA